MSYTNDKPAMESQLPLTVEYPEEDKAFKEKLYVVNQRTASSVNTKIGGLYVPEEKTTGAQYYDSSNPQKNKNVYRMTVKFGALPNATTKSVPHNIPGWNAFYELKQMYGGATDTANLLGIAVPNDTILLRMDRTDVIITTTANYSNYTLCDIVIEYTKSAG